MYSLIITDYKSMSDTVDYIKKFIDIYVGNDVHYIIVDNSAEELGKQFLQDSKVEFTSSTFNGKKVYSFEVSQRTIYIIDSNENGGYSKGNNLGAKFAIQNFDTPYLIFSNNDLEFPNGLRLEECKTIIETSDNPVGIVGPK